MVHGYKVNPLVRSILAGPNHITLILISNPDIRSARFYGQFLLDDRLTLQAGLDCTRATRVVGCMLRRRHGYAYNVQGILYFGMDLAMFILIFIYA